jgi:predicted double-glycine peptidase
MQLRWYQALILAAAVGVPACVYVPASNFHPATGTDWNSTFLDDESATLSVSLQLDALKTASAQGGSDFWKGSQVSVSVLRDQMLLDVQTFKVGTLSADKLKFNFDSLTQGPIEVCVEVRDAGGTLIGEGVSELALRTGRKSTLTLAVRPTQTDDDPYDPSAPLPTPRPLAHADPNAFFLCQMYDLKWNPNAPAWTQNCGPASLAMVLKAYDMIPPLIGTPEDPQEFILKTRRAMTGNESDVLTSLEDLERGAEALGFAHERTYGYDAVRTAVMLGKPVIVAGNPVVYGPRFGSDRYAAFDGGHFVLVTGMTASQVFLNDPLSRKGNITVTTAEFRSYMGHKDWTAYR